MMMQSLSKRWYIKPHYVMENQTQKLFLLYAAGDVEGHLIAHENRYYLLDLGRYFPPTLPDSLNNEDKQFFYRLFRPEFISTLQRESTEGNNDGDGDGVYTDADGNILKPLCPDAFSKWEYKDSRVERFVVCSATQTGSFMQVMH
jgi:hypothetical protein